MGDNLGPKGLPEEAIVTTFKTYHGAHQGTFLGAAPSGREIHFEALDAIRVHNGKITEHWVWRISS
jgi:predicted ester cyclase